LKLSDHVLHEAQNRRPLELLDTAEVTRRLSPEWHGFCRRRSQDTGEVSCWIG
jgi:hypothetical protein